MGDNGDFPDGSNACHNHIAAAGEISSADSIEVLCGYEARTIQLDRAMLDVPCGDIRNSRGRPPRRIVITVYDEFRQIREGLLAGLRSLQVELEKNGDTQGMQLLANLFERPDAGIEAGELLLDGRNNSVLFRSGRNDQRNSRHALCGYLSKGSATCA